MTAWLFSDDPDRIPLAVWSVFLGLLLLLVVIFVGAALHARRKELSMPLLARDVMTKELITVTPATPLSEFARICTEDGISGCPVTRADGALCGIVSKTDLLNRLLEEHPDATREDIRRYLAGNLCRCGSYVKIADAVEDVLERRRARAAG